MASPREKPPPPRPRASRLWLIVALLAGTAATLVATLGGPQSPRPEAEETEAEARPALRFEPVEVSAPGQSGLTLSGRVLDTRGQPLPGAEVSLASSEERTAAVLRCESCGQPLLACRAPESALHMLELLEQGQGFLEPRASVRAGGEGRFRFERLRGVSFTVWARAPGFGAAVRERAAPGEPVELYLPPSRNLRGRVLDREGQPVAGARVFAVSRKAPLRHEARADSQGAFVLADLGEGSFHVLAVAEGFLPGVEPQAAPGPQPLELRLEPARELEVLVTRGGRPAEATVRLQGEHLSREARTQAGRALFQGLSPMELTATAEAPPRLGAGPHVLMLSERLARVELQLEEAGTLLVTVVDEAGQPAPSPQVALQTTEGRLLRQQQAATGALVVLGPVAPGEYVLEGRALGFQPTQLPARVGPGEQPLELRLERAPQVSGQVLDMYGRPASGVVVRVRPTGEEVVADGEGHFLAPVPTPGLYTLQAYHSEWGGAQVQVTAPAQGVRLELQPGATVEVVVVSGGQRVEGASAQLLSARHGVFRGDRPSGADGVVTLRGLEPGAYELVVTHREYLASAPRLLEVAEAQVQRATVELQTGGTLSGEVVNPQGTPVAGASVEAMPPHIAVAEAEEGAPGGTPGVTDSQGRFELRALRTGALYRLAVAHPHYEQRQSTVGRAGAERVRVIMEPRGRYRGRVVSEQGAPVRRFRLNGQEVTDPEGRFEVALTVVDERVWLAVEAQGFQPERVERPAQPELGELVLRQAPLVRGWVRDSAGAPVAEALVTSGSGGDRAVTGPEGRFELPAPPQVEGLLVTARKGRLRGAARASPRGGEVEVVLHSLTRLSGQVTQADGQPAAGFHLYGVNLEQGERLSIVTGADGRYSMELAPGEYLLLLETGPGSTREWRGRVEGAELRLDFSLAPQPASPTPL